MLKSRDSARPVLVQFLNVKASVDTNNYVSPHGHAIFCLISMKSNRGPFDSPARKRTETRVDKVVVASGGPAESVCVCVWCVNH